MSLSPETKAPTDLSPSPAPGANGSPHPGLFPAPSPSGNGQHRALPGSGRRGGRWTPYLAALAGLLVLGGGIAAFVLTREKAERPDVLLHTVKKQKLDVTVTEKGTLESAENKDVVCKVRAGQKGFATTINWVIEDGAMVEPGQLLMILDDSALQDQYRDQKIKVDQALALKITAEKQYEITVKEGERVVAEADNALVVARINLDQYIGLSYDKAQSATAAVVGVAVVLAEDGAYRQKFDDLTGQIRLAESDLEQYRERSSWADRMVKLTYMSPSQAQAERSKLESAIEKLRSLQSQRSLLSVYERRMQLATLRSAVDNAKLKLDKEILNAEATRATADIERKTKTSVYDQEMEKLRDMEDQIKECRIYAPQRGMVVYFRQESRRFGSTPDGLIEQGAQVKEGQKLLRIPNLDMMQVNTKVHEAMVDRIQGDERVSTGLLAQMRVGLLANPSPFGRLVSQHEGYLSVVHHEFRDHEYKTTKKGQRATVRVDAKSSLQLPARVRSVAGVASQTDSWISDVKVYQTLVLIEKPVPGLKPDMTAEVTIHVDGIEDVLAVPLQSVVGGAEMGAKRKVFVKAGAGYEEREVTLGLYNETMVEVRTGLAEGDEVVINPKVLLGDSKQKTRDGGEEKGGNGAKGGGGKGAYPGGGEGGKKGTFDPSKKRKSGGAKGGEGGGAGPQQG